MKIEHLTGLIAAPFTPMDSSGMLNLPIIPKYYEMLKSNGVKGAFICGSTGEGVSMTLQEKMKVAEAWAACTKNDKDFKVMAFASGTSVHECIEIAKHAGDQGLYGVSITGPFYFKPPTVDALAEICEMVAAQVPHLPFY